MFTQGIINRILNKQVYLTSPKKQKKYEENK